MKNIVPDFKTKTETVAFLRANKSKLIAQKKVLPTFSDNLDFGYKKVLVGKTFATKAAPVDDIDTGELPVEIIANMAGWCDSQMDVMLKDSWKKSITELSASGQRLTYHLKDHDYSMDAIIGKDPEFYSQDIDLSIFNITSDIKKSQALICSSTIMEKYDEKAFALYIDMQVKQHSIGLQYIQMQLCIDSTEDEDVQEKKNWDRYYPQVINKDKVDNHGYFWAVIEAKILEVSAVLWGANILTPVITTGQPSKEDTGKQPPTGTVSTEKSNSPILGCASCDYLFVVQDRTSQSCPNCGCYCSPENSTIMLEDTSEFDWKKAIEHTQFI